MYADERNSNENIPNELQHDISKEVRAELLKFRKEDLCKLFNTPINSMDDFESALKKHKVTRETLSKFRDIQNS